MKFNKSAALFTAILFCVMSFVACTGKGGTTGSGENPGASYYIRIDENELSREYIGYFFYAAQLNMIKETGMITGEGGNSTDKDVEEFWKTTEIEGKKAVEVARNLAADKAVMQTVQYLKALEEGLSLSQEDKQGIEDQIQGVIASGGGEDAFRQTLSDMGTSEEAYKQILTENILVNKLYDQYKSEGKLDVSDSELEAYIINNPDIPAEEMLETARKEKFNLMSQEWEKDHDIVINDKRMEDFNV